MLGWRAPKERRTTSTRRPRERAITRRALNLQFRNVQSVTSHVTSPTYNVQPYWYLRAYLPLASAARLANILASNAAFSAAALVRKKHRTESHSQRRTSLFARHKETDRLDRYDTLYPLFVSATLFTRTHLSSRRCYSTSTAAGTATASSAFGHGSRHRFTPSIR